MQQYKKPTKLADARRWVNTTKLLQAVHNRPQNEFVRVHPGGCVEGAQFEAVCKEPTFKEVLYHIRPDELYELTQKESNVELLEHLAAVEQYSDDPRKAVVSMFRARIKQIEAGDKQPTPAKTTDKKENKPPDGTQPTNG